MIASSYKRFWPADRLARLKSLEKSARRSGLDLRARNGGDRRCFLAYIAFWQGDQMLAAFWDLDGAEAWHRKEGWQ